MTKKTKMLLGILAAVVVIAGAGLFSAQSGMFKGMIFSKNILTTKSVNVERVTSPVSTHTDIPTPAESLPKNVVTANIYECKSGNTIYDTNYDKGLYATYDDLLTAIDNGTLPNCETRLIMETRDLMFAQINDFPITNLERENGSDPDILISKYTGSDYPFNRVGLFPSGKASMHFQEKDYSTGFTYDRFAIYVK